MNATKKLSRGSTAIDKYVGAQLRMRCTILGMSQEKVADTLGLTFQQVQKYERGTNRMSAARLYNVAQVLDVPVAYFYEGLGEATSAKDKKSLTSGADYPQGMMAQKETRDLLRYYYAIEDERLRGGYLCSLPFYCR